MGKPMLWMPIALTWVPTWLWEDRWWETVFNVHFMDGCFRGATASVWRSPMLKKVEFILKACLIYLNLIKMSILRTLYGNSMRQVRKQILVIHLSDSRIGAPLFTFVSLGYVRGVKWIRLLCLWVLRWSWLNARQELAVWPSREMHSVAATVDQSLEDYWWFEYTGWESAMQLIWPKVGCNT